MKASFTSVSFGLVAAISVFASGCGRDTDFLQVPAPQRVETEVIAAPIAVVPIFATPTPSAVPSFGAPSPIPSFIVPSPVPVPSFNPIVPSPAPSFTLPSPVPAPSFTVPSPIPAPSVSMPPIPTS